MQKQINSNNINSNSNKYSSEILLFQELSNSVCSLIIKEDLIMNFNNEKNAITSNIIIMNNLVIERKEEICILGTVYKDTNNNNTNNMNIKRCLTEDLTIDNINTNNNNQINTNNTNNMNTNTNPNYPNTNKNNVLNNIFNIFYPCVSSANNTTTDTTNTKKNSTTFSNTTTNNQVKQTNQENQTNQINHNLNNPNQNPNLHQISILNQEINNLKNET